MNMFTVSCSSVNKLSTGGSLPSGLLPSHNAVAAPSNCFSSPTVSFCVSASVVAWSPPSVAAAAAAAAKAAVSIKRALPVVLWERKATRGWEVARVSGGLLRCTA